MELFITLPEENAGIINLKNYIDKATIEGIDGTGIQRTSHEDGQMGAGIILNSIIALINAAEKPLVELVACLQRYVDTFRTEITINDGKGGSITLKSGKKVDQQVMQGMIKDFLQRT